AVADVTQTFESVATECSLKDFAVAGAIKQSAPLLELTHTFWRLLRMNLRHAPVVQKLSTAHGVAKVGAPVVRLVHISHRCGDPAPGHTCVRLAQSRLANSATRRALAQRGNCCAQAGATRPDDQHIMFVCLVFITHNNLRSEITPVASSLM